MKTFLRLCLHGALVIGAVDATFNHVKKAPAALDSPVTKAPVDLYARQASAQICGFKSGNPKDPRLPASGWYCATDTVLNYWGFCPTTITDIASCPIARLCVDSGPCSQGCGRLDYSSTYSWYEPTCTVVSKCTNGQQYSQSANVCLEDLLISDAQTYRYFSCGATSRSNDVYLATPIANPTTQKASPTPPSELPPTANPPTVPTATSSSRVSSSSTSQATSTTSGTGTSGPAVQSSNAASAEREVQVLGAGGSLFFFLLAYV